MRDDEPLAREGLRLLLLRDPEVTSVDEAAGGREAVARLRERRPDLLFLDVQMPEMDGFAVLHALGAQALPDRASCHACHTRATRGAVFSEPQP